MSNTTTILVVEDEDEVRTVLVRILSSEGYRVLEASDGFQAIEVLKSETDVDLVLSDIAMPRMDGFGLATHLLSASKTPILFMTGHGSQRWREPVPGPVLFKPFSPEELCGEIRRVLATPVT